MAPPPRIDAVAFVGPPAPRVESKPSTTAEVPADGTRAEPLASRAAFAAGPTDGLATDLRTPEQMRAKLVEQFKDAFVRRAAELRIAPHEAHELLAEMEHQGTIDRLVMGREATTATKEVDIRFRQRQFCLEHPDIAQRLASTELNMFKTHAPGFVGNIAGFFLIEELMGMQTIVELKNPTARFAVVVAALHATNQVFTNIANMPFAARRWAQGRHVIMNSAGALVTRQAGWRGLATNMGQVLATKLVPEGATILAKLRSGAWSITKAMGSAPIHMGKDLFIAEVFARSMAYTLNIDKTTEDGAKQYAYLHTAGFFLRGAVAITPKVGASLARILGAGRFGTAGLVIGAAYSAGLVVDLPYMGINALMDGDAGNARDTRATRMSEAFDWAEHRPLAHLFRWAGVSTYSFDRSLANGTDESWTDFWSSVGSVVGIDKGKNIYRETRRHVDGQIRAESKDAVDEYLATARKVIFAHNVARLEKDGTISDIEIPRFLTHLIGEDTNFRRFLTAMDSYQDVDDRAGQFQKIFKANVLRPSDKHTVAVGERIMTEGGETQLLRMLGGEETMLRDLRKTQVTKLLTAELVLAQVRAGGDAKSIHAAEAGLTEITRRWKDSGLFTADGTLRPTALYYEALGEIARTIVTNGDVHDRRALQAWALDRIDFLTPGMEQMPSTSPIAHAVTALRTLFGFEATGAISPQLGRRVITELRLINPALLFGRGHPVTDQMEMILAQAITRFDIKAGCEGPAPAHTPRIFASDNPLADVANVLLDATAKLFDGIDHEAPSGNLDPIDSAAASAFRAAAIFWEDKAKANLVRDVETVVFWRAGHEMAKGMWEKVSTWSFYALDRQARLDQIDQRIARLEAAKSDQGLSHTYQTGGRDCAAFYRDPGCSAPRDLLRDLAAAKSDRTALLNEETTSGRLLRHRALTPTADAFQTLADYYRAAPSSVGYAVPALTDGRLDPESGRPASGAALFQYIRGTLDQDLRADREALSLARLRPTDPKHVWNAETGTFAPTARYVAAKLKAFNTIYGKIQTSLTDIILNLCASTPEEHWNTALYTHMQGPGGIALAAKIQQAIILARQGEITVHGGRPITDLFTVDGRIRDWNFMHQILQPMLIATAKDKQLALLAPVREAMGSAVSKAMADGTVAPDDWHTAATTFLQSKAGVAARELLVAAHRLTRFTNVRPPIANDGTITDPHALIGWIYDANTVVLAKTLSAWVDAAVTKGHTTPSAWSHYINDRLQTTAGEPMAHLMQAQVLLDHEGALSKPDNRRARYYFTPNGEVKDWPLVFTWLQTSIRESLATSYDATTAQLATTFTSWTMAVIQAGKTQPEDWKEFITGVLASSVGQETRALMTLQVQRDRAGNMTRDAKNGSGYADNYFTTDGTIKDWDRQFAWLQPHIEKAAKTAHIKVPTRFALRKPTPTPEPRPYFFKADLGGL